MKYDSQIHHRRSIRLAGYDYSQPGAYFVTMVTWQRQNLFGDIRNQEMNLSLAGQCINSILQSLPDNFPVTLDSWVIMPNHMHIILIIEDHPRRGEAAGAKYGLLKRTDLPAASPLPATRPNGTLPGSLGAIIQNFKSNSARRINILQNTPGAPLWQRNYYEHIIRNDQDWDTARRYILDNPRRWSEDKLFTV